MQCGTVVLPRVALTSTTPHCMKQTAAKMHQTMTMKSLKLLLLLQQRSIHPHPYIEEFVVFGLSSLTVCFQIQISTIKSLQHPSLQCNTPFAAVVVVVVVEPLSAERRIVKIEIPKCTPTVATASGCWWCLPYADAECVAAARLAGRVAVEKTNLHIICLPSDGKENNVRITICACHQRIGVHGGVKSTGRWSKPNIFKLSASQGLQNGEDRQTYIAPVLITYYLLLPSPTWLQRLQGGHSLIT